MKRGFYILLVLFVFFSLSQSKNKIEDKILPEGAVVIDLTTEKNKLEMPKVIFPHSIHTNKLNKKGKSCDVCHLINEKDKKLTLEFIETTEKNVKEKYHQKCLDCHKEEKTNNSVAPLEESCRICHDANYGNIKTSKWKSLSFNKDLHTYHIKSDKLKSTNNKYSDNCYLCHHSYNEKTKEMTYSKDKEDSCVYCHLENIPNKNFEKNASIKREAYHNRCIVCHLEKNKEQKQLKLPTECSSCHISQKFDIKKTDFRIKRGQKDIVLMNSFEKEKPVAFDHKSHEQYNENCITCHHKSLEKCETCHTQKGDKKADLINLSTAMHKISNSERSCIGCHNEQKNKKECAGCHNLVPFKQEQDYTCTDCHKRISSSLKQMKEENIAKSFLNKTPKTFKIKDIPEKIKIKQLERDYNPVDFPHRKIVKSLMEGIENNKLASKFHSNAETICQACHHTGQIKDTKPSACASCHSVSDLNESISLSSKKNIKPNLKTAYHIQCMECHKSMKIEKPVSTDCNSCHKKK